MSTYVVTGAAGFIGSQVSRLLLEQGHHVVGIDNLNEAYDVRIKDWRLNRLVGQSGFDFLKLDIADRQAVEEQLSAFQLDGIINLAARAGVRAAVEIPWVYVETNMTGTLSLLEFCRHHKVPKFVLASTSSLYGANPPLPTPETAESDHPLQPYAASKKGAEALAYSYHHLFGIDVTVFRYFTVYGPAGRPDMVMFRFCQWIAEGRPVRITGDGTQSRGFTFVEDIARGTILGLKPLGYELINLGGHETISINDMVAALERKLGRKANIEYIPSNPADVQENWANVEKARRLLGWQPQVGLDEGMGRLVDWYLAERAWAKDIETK
jgi:nucleoside-diphosphate-sugar epimerase